VYLASQCINGPLHPELYRSGSVAIQMGVAESGMQQMTPEAAVVSL
jgi:L-asparaginase